MRSRGEILFGLAVAAFAAWALLETRGWAIKTALYPRAIGVPLLLLALVEAVLSLRGKPEGDVVLAMDIELPADVEPEMVAHRTATIFGWIAAFFLGVVALGFPIAVPLFAFAYLVSQARERWLPSLLLSALAWLIFYELFIRLLRIPFAEGLLFRLLGR